MTGSKEEGRMEFDSYDEALKWAIDNDWVKGRPNEQAKKLVVFKCDWCGEYSWGVHTSKHCLECRKAVAHDQTRKSRERAKMKRQMIKESKSSDSYVGFGRIAYCDMDQKFATSFEAIQRHEAVERENAKLIKWNNEHTCPLADNNGRSVQCFYCMRGLPYAGATNLSDRRCPDNPISPTGARYIQRTKNWKDTDSLVSHPRARFVDVADSMPEQLKVQLVERMRKVGRELYIWSDGHVDITPEPDSNRELREVLPEEDTRTTEAD